jgi:hypothetical protein
MPFIEALGQFSYRVGENFDFPKYFLLMFYLKFTILILTRMLLVSIDRVILFIFEVQGLGTSVWFMLVLCRF